MAYDGTRPSDTEFIANAPALIRENFRALKDDKIVNAGKLQDKTPGNGSSQIPVSNGTLCTNLNAEKLGGYLASYFSPFDHEHPCVDPDIIDSGFMSNTDKIKLDGIEENAQVNQNTFANITIGDTTIQADQETDTLYIVADSGIALTPDPSNDRLTIGISSISDAKIGNRTLDQSQIPSSSTGMLTQILSWLGNRIKAITGKANWYDTPDKSLAELNSEKVNKSGDTMTGNLGLNAVNAGLELGSTSQPGGPYIAFHSSGNNIDYDVRFSACGGTTENGKGTLTINAAELKVNADKVWHQGNHGHGNGLDADLLDGKQLSEIWENLSGNRSSDLNLQPSATDGSGNVGIIFNSKVSANDRGYLRWYDNNDAYAYWGSDSTENGALVMGVENDGKTNASDVVVLESPAAVISNAPETRLLGVLSKTATADGYGVVTGQNVTLIDEYCRVWRAVFNDLAEMMPCGEKTEPGDVCIWDETIGGVRKGTSEDDPRVVGVHSDSYGFLLGGPLEKSPEEIKDHSPIGISGQVWVKAKGVQAGDLLTTSDEPGVAKKSTELVPGSVFAKALESAPDNKVKRIRALIMLR